MKGIFYGCKNLSELNIIKNYNFYTVYYVKKMKKKYDPFQKDNDLSELYSLLFILNIFNNDELSYLFSKEKNEIKIWIKNNLS